jgi:hypothetical protein
MTCDDDGLNMGGCGCGCLQAAFVPEALAEEEEAVDEDASSGVVGMVKASGSQRGSAGSLAPASGSAADLVALGPPPRVSSLLHVELAGSVGDADVEEEEEEEGEEAEDTWSWLTAAEHGGFTVADAFPCNNTSDVAQGSPPSAVHTDAAPNARDASVSAAAVTSDGAAAAAAAAGNVDGDVDVAAPIEATPALETAKRMKGEVRASTTATATSVDGGGAQPPTAGPAAAAAAADKAAPTKARKARTYERNKHAEVLVARVAAKLGGGGSGGGGDGEGASKAATALAVALPVPEQVELLLREATSLDNLCQMYEGWMAWI